MDHQVLLYSFSSIAIASTLFAAIVICNELSFRFGRMVQAETDDDIKALTGSVQASILGLLALLLGFTFSMSMQRFDNRSMALIDEANAIGSAVLRVELLPKNQQESARALFKDYIELRVAAGKLDITQRSERQKYQQHITELQNKLWHIAVTATQEDPRSVTTGAFIKSLNDAFDSQVKRGAILQAHVPEPILLLLFFVFVSSISMMGYSSGLSGKRLTVPVMLVSLLIALIVFIIIDLDRPRRGIITVNQSAMTDLIELSQNVKRSE